MDDRTERERLLQVYLSDHLAGSVAGTRLARRLADAERDGPAGPALTALADDIEADRSELVKLVDALGIEPRRYKQALVWAGERLGRLKLNGHLVRRSPLSTVVEMESLLMALRGKLAGWEAVRSAFGEHPVGGLDLERLMARGEAQLDTLGALHRAATARALGAQLRPEPGRLPPQQAVHRIP
jgi:hypothetical protein